MARGRLRLYLGAAPGVGKTYAMLDEARRRRERGSDVVVAYVETHGRPKTTALLDGLEVVPRRRVSYRGTVFEELDTAAVLARRPAVALVDELAHTNIPEPGVPGRHGKRWRDVEDLLAAGIDVISTVNIQHLESVNDVVETITGVPQRETVPDEVVRRADQVELVDISPEALRRRMAHGNIYAADKVDAALANYFREGNLTALRELALLWVAGKVDEQLDAYRDAHGITGTWEARERVVVALTGGPEGETLIRRAARIAARSKGAELLAIHVVAADGLAGADQVLLARQRTLAESLGGSYHQVVGDSVPDALLAFARAENATQLVLGASRRGRFAQLVDPGIGVTVTRRSGAIDVHLVSHSEVGRGRRLPGPGRALSRRRAVAGSVLAAAALVALTAVLSAARAQLTLTSDVLLFLVVVVLAALVGGIVPALLAALAGSALLNYYFVPPLHTFTIDDRDNIVAVVVFVAVGLTVASVVHVSLLRRRRAARAAAEAAVLSTLAGGVLRGEHALPALLERVRETFAMSCVTLLERPDESDADGGPATAGPAEGWRVVASVGAVPCRRPDDGDAEVPVGENLVLALRGRPLPAEDRRILTAFAAQAAVALERERLAAAAASARPLAEAERVRTALLAAVSHDLRTPLAAAKAAVTSLRGEDIAWTPTERAELLATADEAMDRLTHLVENLLDMSRLEAGALSVFPRPVGLDDVVPLALDELGPPARAITIAIPAELPEVAADPGLLERIVVNLAANALRHSPPDTPPVISASALGDRVELRVIDRGPGIPAADRDRVFQPFQRQGDQNTTAGVGLGLALSRGLAEAMGGSLVPEDTPGGGVTMVVALPAAAPPSAAPPSAAEPVARGPRRSVGITSNGRSPGDDRLPPPG